MILEMLLLLDIPQGNIWDVFSFSHLPTFPVMLEKPGIPKEFPGNCSPSSRAFSLRMTLHSHSFEKIGNYPGGKSSSWALPAIPEKIPAWEKKIPAPKNFHFFPSGSFSLLEPLLQLGIFGAGFCCDFWDLKIQEFPRISSLSSLPSHFSRISSLSSLPFFCWFFFQDFPFRIFFQDFGLFVLSFSFFFPGFPASHPCPYPDFSRISLSVFFPGFPASHPSLPIFFLRVSGLSFLLFSIFFSPGFSASHAFPFSWFFPWFFPRISIPHSHPNPWFSPIPPYLSIP